MKLVLASNLLEHPHFDGFVKAVLEHHPDAAFLVSGDLLNVFPEPGEDLEGSMFHALYGGTLINDEMNRLVRARFKDVQSSPFLEPLRQMFVPTGERYEEAQRLALSRYGRLLPKLDLVLKTRPFYFIPGNMDYPRLAERVAGVCENLHLLDQDVVRLGAARVGGLGGVPNTVHPFRGVTEISPYEMTEAEYARRLERLWGVDILVTHISPQEYPPLERFVQESPLKLLVCRAPFDFTRQGDFRGKLEVQQLGTKRVVQVRPFDFPVNHAFIIDVSMDAPVSFGIEVFSWQHPGSPPSSLQRGELPVAATAPVTRASS